MAESLLAGQTILLLGATGQVGTVIRTTLAAHAPACRVICVSRQAWTGTRHPQETWATLDPLRDDLGRIGQVDVVVNAVGAMFPTAEAPLELVHTGLTARILQARATLGQPRIVQVSALGATPTHATAFLRTKGEADAMLLAAPDTCVLRPSIVCTPDTLLSRRLRQLLGLARLGFGKMVVPEGFGATRLQPVLGEDLGWAVLKAAATPSAPQLLDVVGPAPIAMEALLAEMAAAQGRKVQLVEVSREIVASFVKHFVGVWWPTLIGYEQFLLLFEDNVADAGPLRALIGREPRDTLAFWRQEAESPQPEASETPLQHALEGH